MNMPVAENQTVHFTTTLFALIRESLAIKMGPSKITFNICCVGEVIGPYDNNSLTLSKEMYVSLELISSGILDFPDSVPKMG